MKIRVLIFTLLAATLLTNAGCLHAVREEREKKAEAAFAKLASRPPEQVAGFLNGRLGQCLALTPAQRPVVEAINLKYARQLQLTAASPDNMRTKVKALKQQAAAKEAELKPILTPEQFARYLELKDELRETLKSMAESQRNN